MHRGLSFGMGLFLGLLMLSRLGGIQLYAVMSGSMAPSLPVGSLVISGKASPSSIREGEVITYLLPDGNTRVTHRVVEVQGGRFITRGDANERADAAPVEPSQVLGRMVAHLPYLGYLLVFFLSREGKAILLGGALLLCLLALYEEREGRGGFRWPWD